jgi:hypothetical protein
MVRPGDKSPEERQARYELMDAHVRTHLLPYDFSLTELQESELLEAVRAELQATNNEELFSAILRFKVEEVVDRKIRYWREEHYRTEQGQRLQEIRNAAGGYVGVFLDGQATPLAIEQLKARLKTDDLQALETQLTEQIQQWVVTVEDNELLQYDAVTVRDLVFAQLRSWC